MKNAVSLLGGGRRKEGGRDIWEKEGEKKGEGEGEGEEKDGGGRGVYGVCMRWWKRRGERE